MPKAVHPIAPRTELPPRRKQRQPRELSYKKCAICRDPKVKAKCRWENGPWPNKCTRCSEKKLPCSQPRLKADERYEIVQTSTIERIPSAVYDDARDRRALHLLSLHSMAIFACEEFQSLGEELLNPVKHDPMWNLNADRLYREWYDYRSLITLLQEKIKDAPISKMAMIASLDLAAFSHTSMGKWHQEPEVFCRYLNGGHSGMVVVLLLRQFLLRPKFVEEHISTFIRFQQEFLQEFLSDIKKTFDDHRQVLPDEVDICQLPCFIPAKLLKHDSIRDHIRKLNSKDFLHRSVALLEYDGGLQNVCLDIKEDREDYWRRTILHAACARDDEDTVNALIAKGLVSDTSAVSGLSPLYIVASRGHLNNFRNLLLYYERSGIASFMLSRRDNCYRTFFACAARCGHANIIEFYLSRYKFRWGRNKFVCPEAELHRDDLMIAFALVLEYNHLGVVRAIADNLDIVHLSDIWSCTPFWWAVFYKRLDAMRILEKVSIVDQADYEGCSPLAKAARGGFLEGVEYLLSLNTSGRLRVHPLSRDNEGKTPQMIAEENGHNECARLLAKYIKDTFPGLVK